MLLLLVFLVLEWPSMTSVSREAVCGCAILHTHTTWRCLRSVMPHANSFFNWIPPILHFFKVLSPQQSAGFCKPCCSFLGTWMLPFQVKQIVPHIGDLKFNLLWARILHDKGRSRPHILYTWKHQTTLLELFFMPRRVRANTCHFNYSHDARFVFQWRYLPLDAKSL